VVIFLVTILVTLVFHRFWSTPPDEAIGQQLMFMKNVSVMGGLLVLFAFGPGNYALDDKVRRQSTIRVTASPAGS
jgi:putative oxidoreductase